MARAMASCKVQHLLLLCFFLNFIAETTRAEHRPKYKEQLACRPLLFVFGASLLDVGENAAAMPGRSVSEFPPYGVHYFGRPAARFSNGRMLIDFISQGLGYGFIDPFLKSLGSNFKHGVNFASSGATARNSTISGNGTSSLGLFSLNVQMDQFIQFKRAALGLKNREVEYVAATTATCHAIWLRRLLKDMAHTEKDPTSIFCDNSSAIQLSKHNVFHGKSKHIDSRYHFIRELFNDGQISLLFCGSKEQLADMFTKQLGTSAFVYKREHLGIDSAEDVLPVEIWKM